MAQWGYGKGKHTMPLDFSKPHLENTSAAKTHYRTLWLSDIHLGSPACQVESLLAFLKNHTCDTLYLVGDIIDGWKLSSRVYWPQSHTDVIRRFLTMAKRGTRIVFITGNHDEFLRKYSNTQYGNIELRDEACHITADNRRLMVLHGDQFDEAKNAYSKLAKFFAYTYDDVVEWNSKHNRWRTQFGLPALQLPRFLKQQTKAQFIAEYEQWIASAAQQRGYDGAVCGHIHHAQNRSINGTQYLNCGDWVESCTALGEAMDGSISVIHWSEQFLPHDATQESPVDEEESSPLELLTLIGGLEVEALVHS